MLDYLEAFDFWDIVFILVLIFLFVCPLIFK